jgi:hypothetical protein
VSADSKTPPIRMIPQGPGSLKLVPERLRVAFMPRHSRTDSKYLKGFGSRPGGRVAPTKKAPVRAN